MDSPIKSILDELQAIIPERDKYVVLEARASHIISSAINLLKAIRESFPENEANELTKRLFLSIKNEDQRKFKLGLKKLKENRNKNSNLIQPNFGANKSIIERKNSSKAEVIENSKLIQQKPGPKNE